MIGLREQTVVGRLIEAFVRKYPAVPPDTVAAVVRDIHARFDGRPLRDYVPLLVERRARSELVRLARSGVSLSPHTGALV
jgi:hypothetical protein